MSTRKMAQALGNKGHRISQQKVAELLRDLGYSLRPPLNLRGIRNRPDCDTQFQHLCNLVREFQADRQPVVTVDTKSNGLDSAQGSAPFPAGQSSEIRSYSTHLPATTLTDPQHSDAVWDQHRALLMGRAIRTWWDAMGQEAFPAARRLLVAAAWAGDARARREWTRELQGLANTSGLTIQVCHLPAGTRKWTGVVHVLESRFTQGWHGRPLSVYEVGVSLLAPAAGAGAGTQPGSVGPERGWTDKSISARQVEYSQVQITRDEPYGEWNYRVAPLPPD